MGIVKTKDRGRASKRRLKQDATLPERTLMVELNARRERYSFQYVVQTDENDGGFYVVDFYLPRRKLLVELDGAGHFTSTGHWRDRLRTEAIERARPDLLLVRFSNSDVTKDARALVDYLRTY
jgi:very-short-patch-repair endonuclease